MYYKHLATDSFLMLIYSDLIYIVKGFKEFCLFISVIHWKLSEWLNVEKMAAKKIIIIKQPASSGYGDTT